MMRVECFVECDADNADNAEDDEESVEIRDEEFYSAEEDSDDDEEEEEEEEEVFHLAQEDLSSPALPAVVLPAVVLPAVKPALERYRSVLPSISPAVARPATPAPAASSSPTIVLTPSPNPTVSSTVVSVARSSIASSVTKNEQTCHIFHYIRGLPGQRFRQLRIDARRLKDHILQVIHLLEQAIKRIRRQSSAVFVHLQNLERSMSNSASIELSLEIQQQLQALPRDQLDIVISQMVDIGPRLDRLLRNAEKIRDTMFDEGNKNSMRTGLGSLAIIVSTAAVVAGTLGLLSLGPFGLPIPILATVVAGGSAMDIASGLYTYTCARDAINEHRINNLTAALMQQHEHHQQAERCTRSFGDIVQENKQELHLRPVVSKLTLRQMIDTLRPLVVDQPGTDLNQLLAAVAIMKTSLNAL